MSAPFRITPTRVAQRASGLDIAGGGSRALAQCTRFQSCAAERLSVPMRSGRLTWRALLSDCPLGACRWAFLSAGARPPWAQGATSSCRPPASELERSRAVLTRPCQSPIASRTAWVQAKALLRAVAHGGLEYPRRQM
ncbi:hypothetical protein NDU88_002651 [Pleurodeles waltl]|uniref:Uncharacterized protein n=1 Tax=Pleurodeles waltl TaxID=8319 RepID=A0AAV7SEA7_PLEWA|nr:hypothetical protein NDU88_002651 [Pleurodeles waltl]